MRNRGNPRLGEHRNSDVTNANLKRQLDADEFVIRQLHVMILQFTEERSNREQAAWMNSNGYKTRNLNDWSERAVHRYWLRVQKRQLRSPGQQKFIVTADDLSDPW
jgi:hypothetical protein